MTSFIGFLALVIMLTAIASTSADAREKRRVLVSSRAASFDKVRRADDEYAARAQSRDPAGNYKDYPNWARAALGGSGSTPGR